MAVCQGFGLGEVGKVSEDINNILNACSDTLAGHAGRALVHWCEIVKLMATQGGGLGPDYVRVKSSFDRVLGSYSGPTKMDK